MVDVFLIVVTVVAFFLLFVAGFYLMVNYQHPDDKNDAYFPKIVVIFGFVLAGATVLLLPLDVANNEGYAGCDGYDTNLCGGLNMELFWEIFFWLIPIWVFVMIPFSTFFYEADDGMLMAGAPGGPENAVRQSRARIAACNMIVVVVVVGLVFGISYLVLSDTNIPVVEYEGATIDIARATGMYDTTPGSSFPNGTQRPFETSQLADINTNDTLLLREVTNNGEATITLQVDVSTYFAGLMAWLGWFFFAIFGGIGIAAMPMDLIMSYVNRPRHMSPEEFAEAQLSIQSRVNDLVEIGEDLKREREERYKTEDGSIRSGGSSAFGGFFSAEVRKQRADDRKTMKEFQAAVFLLEKDVQEFTACSANYEKYNPLLPYFSLILGMLAFIISCFWILHILLFIIPAKPVTPFLNNFFEWFDGWFPLFGVLSVAIFSVYLLLAAVKGCFKFGLRFLCINLHPMQPNRTYMSSFLFNIGLVLLCALPVVQFCTTAFEDYARFATVRQIFGIQIEYLEFFTLFWTNNIFVYALLTLAVITTIYLACRPRDAASDSKSLRDKLQSRRS